LHAACGRRDLDLTQSIFGPASVTWRVNGETAVLLGGGRALLLQVAHPLVAAGVAAHSRFRSEPLRRLWRTLDLMLTMAFADAARVMAALRQIERVHARVHGRLDEAVGPFEAGTPYDANNPDLLLWVHATLVDTASLVYERFVAPLSRPERARYYEESKIAARLFRIPEALIPRTLADFRAYMQNMIGGDVLAVSPASRAIAASILHPPVPLPLRPAFRVANLFTVGLLPPALRQRYGLAWNRLSEAALRAVPAVTLRTIPFLPDLVRRTPHARRGSRAALGGTNVLRTPKNDEREEPW
jgi:uncharacterized protein (DUF2236 family)